MMPGSLIRIFCVNTRPTRDGRDGVLKGREKVRGAVPPTAASPDSPDKLIFLLNEARKC